MSNRSSLLIAGLNQFCYIRHEQHPSQLPLVSRKAVLFVNDFPQVVRNCLSGSVARSHLPQCNQSHRKAAKSSQSMFLLILFLVINSISPLEEVSTLNFVLLVSSNRWREERFLSYFRIRYSSFTNPTMNTCE